MVQQLSPQTDSQIVYPDSDGQPMADNTKQFRWIVFIKENLEILFAAIAEVFVAGDLYWYPVEKKNKIRQAPDIMVVFGRPKGDRSSYRQWLEDNIPPQVVFEILSPGNRTGEMLEKLLFYQRHGVEEYYIYNPNTIELVGFLRGGEWLERIEAINGWVSPRLGIRFEVTENTLEIYRPDGQRFLTSVELDGLKELERQRAEAQSQRAETERIRAEAQSQRAEAQSQRANDAIAALEREQQRYQALVEKLLAGGIDPEQL